VDGNGGATAIVEYDIVVPLFSKYFLTPDRVVEAISPEEYSSAGERDRQAFWISARHPPFRVPAAVLVPVLKMV
jgi:hypothetical protein